MRIIEEEQLDFDDLMMSPKRSTLNSRSEVNLLRDFRWKGENGKEMHLNCIPVIIANMATIATTKIAKIAAKRGFMCALEKHLPVPDILMLYDDLKALAKLEGQCEDFYSQRIMPTIGLKEDIATFKEIQANYDLRCVCIDVPNGYVPRFIERVKEVRKICSNALLFAGNVVTGDICQDIILAGGNVAKCGIGPSGVCLTREKTGVGRPQASAVIECADACHQVDGFCCSDGGCKSPGDIAKAFGCGADFVMCGGMFAGAEEAEGEVVYINNKPHKQFYGMSSNLAQEKHFGGIRKYSTSEGREKYVPVVGPIESIFDDICGGLKSACTYLGARKIKNLPKNCTFYKVRHQLNMKFDKCKDI